jgi:hypothetical protein
MDLQTVSAVLAAFPPTLNLKVVSIETGRINSIKTGGVTRRSGHAILSAPLGRLL